jgi:general secretion pathway protein F
MPTLGVGSVSARLMQFEVKAIRDTGSKISVLQIAAATSDEARDRAQSQGFRIIGISQGAGDQLGRSQRGTAEILAAGLSAELLALLRAGLSLPESMSALQKRQRTVFASETVDQLCQALLQGRSFSKALEQCNANFSELFIATIRSSEQTGDLTEALARYLDYHRRMHAVRSTLISATIYPALLLVVGCLVTGFLLGYVVPRFSRIYADLGEAHIPAASVALMRFGQFIDHNRGAVMAAGMSCLLISIFVLRQPAFRARLNRWLWRIPSLGKRVHLYQLARFSHTLAMLLRGGVTMVNALSLALGVMQLPTLRSQVETARQRISHGQPISISFQQQHLATEIAVRMLAAGERTGNMPEMMEHVARLYDDELAQWIQRFTRLFEPLLMTAIGLTIGLLVMLMYLPIFSLASSLE